MAEKTPVLINMQATEYSLKDVRYTCTVGDLIEALQGFDEDAPIYFEDPSGYGSTCFYGGIHPDDIYENWDE